MKTIRFLHCSDTHLGKTHSLMRKDSESNRNLMSLDTENQFSKIIDIGIDRKVDFMVHSGDMFDKVNVKHIDIAGAQRALTKLSNTDIPFITIAGNHERTFTQGIISPIELLQYLPNVYPITSYDTKTVNVNGSEVALHGISYIRNESEIEYPKQINLRKEKEIKGYNILLSHQLVSGSLAGFETSASLEPKIPAEIFPENWNYIAMGHIHRRQTIKHPKNEELPIHFPGSPIIIDFDERKEDKSVSIVSITGSNVEIEKISLSTRDFKEIKVNIDNPTSEEIETMIKSHIENNLDMERYLGIRLNGGVQLALRRFTQRNYYRDYLKNLAGFDIYHSTSFQWYDQKGEAISISSEWLNDPVKELKAAIGDHEGLSNEDKDRYMKIGENIIKQHKETN